MLRYRNILTLLLLLYGSALLAGNPPTGDTTLLRVVGVTIVGNKVTRPQVIMRELTFAEGDVLPSDELYARMERSQQNLMNTALFNSVVILPAYLSSSDVLVEITLNERWYLWPSPILQLADPNFNVWWETRDLDRLNIGFFLNHYNFRGMNENVYLKMQFGYTQQFGLRYRVPFFDKAQKWGFSAGASYAQQKEITVGTLDNERILLSLQDRNMRTTWQGDLELSLRRSHDVRHYWRLGYTQAEVQDTVTAHTPEYFRNGRTSTTFLTAGYTFIWDQRDLKTYPKAGRYAELKLDRYGLGPLSSNAPDVTTAYGTVKKWWPLGRRWTMAGSLRGKATLGGPPSYFIQEGLGYGNYVRGYEYYVIDGEHFALAKANVLFTLIAPRTYRLEPVPLEAFRTLYIAVYLNAFVDAGRTWDSRYAAVNPLANDALAGYGLGLDLVTSYDQVMRLEFSVNRLQESGLYLHFTQPF